MKQLICVLSLVLLLLTNSNAQQHNLDSLLESQLGSFQVRFEELMQLRGLRYSSGRITCFEIINALNYLEDYDDKSYYLLFYHFENDNLSSWLINGKGIVAYQTAHTSAKELSDLERALKSAIGVIFHASAPDGAYVGRGLEVDSENGNGTNDIDSVQNRISELLLPYNIAQSILKTENADSVKHLLIVPELNIGTIPFYLLKPFGDSSYLIEKASVCFEPSLDELLNRIMYFHDILHIDHTVRYKTEFIPDSPLVIGNPDFTGCNNFYSLPGATDEGLYVATSLNTSLLTGKAAQKQTVLKKLKHSEFLYFATHGVSDNVRPLDKSYLVLSGKNGCEYWTAREMQSDTFKRGTIVVLSACQTGLGQAVDAGIMGIGRSFIKGGAGNVVTSLWSINDKSAKELMHLFIDELRVPHVFYPADNLRSAILKYKQLNPAPSGWAPFTILGTPYPLNMSIALKNKI